MSIEGNAIQILEHLYRIQTQGVYYEVDGPILQQDTRLSPIELNDTIDVLEDAGFVEVLRELGKVPYDFRSIQISPRGKLEYERMQRAKEQKTEPVKRHRLPVISPYGFREEDYEAIEESRAEKNVVRVVLGRAFETSNYLSDDLVKNVREDFNQAMDDFNKTQGTVKSRLEFKPLSAGYGEHLFNEIARDIISADIGVFDTSGLNPNVMLEMGVALTYGVIVLPIKKEGSPKPPSDISGQTWAEYRDSGAIFLGDNHAQKLRDLIKRAAWKRARLVESAG